MRLGMFGWISRGAERRDDPLVEWIQFGAGASSVNVLSQGRCGGEVFGGLVRQFRMTTCLLVEDFRHIRGHFVDTRSCATSCVFQSSGAPPSMN